MGHREVRPVALGWEHPREPGTRSDGSPRYRPLYSRADLLRHLEFNADCPLDELIDIDKAEYMPEMREGTPFGYRLYETTSEGTPVSPVFPSLPELAGWCEDGAAVFAGHKWTRDQWLASFEDGSLDTGSLMVADAAGFHPAGTRDGA
jgi:hypothetical protein